MSAVSGATFGERLTKAMKAAGKKNPEIAEQMGVHPTTVSKWRTDVQEPTETQKIRLAAYLGLEPSEFSDVVAQAMQASTEWQRHIAVLVAIYEGSAHQLVRLAVEAQMDIEEMVELALRDGPRHIVPRPSQDQVDSAIETARSMMGSRNYSRSRGTAGGLPEALALPRHARNLPLAIREYLVEFELRLTRSGATEEEVDEAIALLRSPQVFTFYKGGVPSEFNEDQVLRGMKAIGEGVIVPTLRERGRKVE